MFNPVALPVLLISVVSVAFAQPQPLSVDEWLKTNAIPLSTVQAGNGFADLQPLKKIIGTARIVSLGEATHGTREFFQLKHRMLEFLASEMGFTIFSIEANMPEAYRLNDYVLNGNGDPAELLRGMYFWTWNTREVLDMIEWMRAFNKSGKGRVEFTGFDMQTPDVAAGIVKDFTTKYDPSYLPELSKAPLQAQAAASAFTTYTGTFPVEDAAGKIVRFSANIKTQDVTGYAGLWWRADGLEKGERKSIAFKNLGNAAPKGSTDWKRYELEIAVPPETQNINFGPLLSGGGTAWFDDLRVTINDIPYSKATGFQVIRPGALPKGSFPTVPGYNAAFVDDTAPGHTGPVLRFVRTTNPDSKAPQPKDASTRWQAVFDHMQKARAGYLSKGASAKDADWAIQNARVVLQCMQMKANQVTRDRSMADNVKWILDHSPDARIVLWAHNGHVGTRGVASYRSMGADLREMYGDQMVIFGFAFNQGSFQAMEMSKGLRNFTVPPAPSGSLDSTLAATRIPLLALDLHSAPAGSPAAAWLKEHHSTRSIGAMFSDETAASYLADIVAPDAYDAVLFVENTNAAVPNPPSANAAIVKCADPPAKTCSDKMYKVTFSLPEGWSVKNSWRWGSKQNTVAFGDAQAGPGAQNPSLYYQILDTPQNRTPEQIRKQHQEAVESKVRSRRENGLADYHLRPESCRTRTVGPRSAYSCISEFTDSTGTAMAEYLTWVAGETADALFFGFVPAKGLDSHVKRFDILIETLRLQ